MFTVFGFCFIIGGFWLPDRRCTVSGVFSVHKAQLILYHCIITIKGCSLLNTLDRKTLA